MSSSGKPFGSRVGSKKIAEYLHARCRGEFARDKGWLKKSDIDVSSMGRRDADGSYSFDISQRDRWGDLEWLAVVKVTKDLDVVVSETEGSVPSNLYDVLDCAFAE